MNETEFHQIAGKILEKIASSLEEADSKGDLEAEYLNGILNIEIKGGRQYIINKHAPTRQIWLSSPVSGASHFRYEDGKWVSGEGMELEEMLGNELKIRLLC